MYRKLVTFLTLVFLIFIAFVPNTNAVYRETENDKKKLFKVIKVIDGDTIVASIRGKNETIRLLGIDSPETVDPRKPVQCFGKQASDKMKSFVLGKFVKLVDDRSQGNRDKYNRLLRFVYLPDSVATFVNGEMVKQGYAFSYRQYPTKFLNKFNSFETYAREHNLGLWNSCPVNDTVTKTPTKTNTYLVPTKGYAAPVQQSGGAYACDCSKSCSAITSCAEAYYQLNTCGCSVRDGDKDGVPCEALCN